MIPKIYSEQLRGLPELKLLTAEKCVFIQNDYMCFKFYSSSVWGMGLPFSELIQPFNEEIF